MSLYLEFIHNVALLVALSTLYSLIARHWRNSLLWPRLVTGLLFGIVAGVGMNLPLHYAPGIIYDGRSIILTLAGLFAGAGGAGVAALIAGAYRFFLGGIGVWAGLATIVGCALVGLGARRLCKNRPESMNLFALYALGLVSHLVMLACQLFLPWPVGVAAIARIWLPVMLIFPLATLVLGQLMINEQRRIITERELGESEEKFSKAFRLSPLLFSITTQAEGRFVDVNQVFSEFTGYARDELLGRTTTEMQFWADPDGRAQMLERLRTQGRVTGLEMPTRLRSGELRQLLFAAEAITLQGEACLLSVSVDISQRLQSEAALKQARDFAENLIATANVIFVELDSSGAVVRLNAAAEEITGYRQSELQGHNWFLTLVPKKSYPYVWEEFTKITERGLFPKVFENPILTKSGAEHYIVWQNKLLHNADGELHTISFGIDITERRQAEEELRQLAAELELRVAQRTAELFEANQELQSFVYSVSHDLRAPLRAISGFAEIIGRRHRQNLNPEGQHYFDNIIEASQRMGELITDLLTYSRLGREGVPARLVDLSGLMAEVLAGFERESDQAEIIVQPVLPVVWGTSTLLFQIFVNLLDNALKYHCREGVVRIEVRAGASSAGWSVIEVADNGLGIAPELQDKIFNLFQRLHNRDDYPGTGIGLAMVKKAAALLGGSVGVKSEPGQGSVFWVRLPTKSPEERIKGGMA
ncbi:MAG: PAS domain S-box protein [Deltaproteobacteria bacterium]|nr:PAS domain S-box protein [Deltaproteobacteria bacterium]